ncbi:MAG: FAD-dependent oxidoreductase [Bacteroidales bacterium]|nr:FAD-dependent oxidoreductase [Bacteroidales bacterium]
MKVVIIGGVAGGATAAARLRRLDEKMEIVLLERGSYLSYANCGLPYYIGGVIPEREDLFRQSVEGFSSKYRVDARVHSEVVAIDPDKKEVRIKNLRKGEEYTESYDKLLISTGANPLKLPIPGVEDQRVFTLRDVGDTDRIKDFIHQHKPRKVLVVGAGFIGLEMVENLQNIGLEVSIVQREDQVMLPLDPGMAALVHQTLEEHQVSVHLENVVKEFKTEGGRFQAHLQKGEVLEADLVIMSVGVRPEVHLAQDAGLELGKLGGIKVNGYLQTSNEDIYAVGDAIEVTNLVTKKPALIALAGPANKQGRIAADNMVLANRSEYKGSIGTSIAQVFDLTVAVAGASSKVLDAEGIPHHESYIPSQSHADYYPGALPLIVKVNFSKDKGTLLGAQVVGRQGVVDIINLFAEAIRREATVYELQEVEHAYAPPYSSAKHPVNMAGYVGENILAGRVKVMQWNELKQAAVEDLFIIDVRSLARFETEHIKGAHHIPVEKLRDRLRDIPKDKKVVLYCDVGYNAYLGTQILRNNGYDKVYNLSGGYGLYVAATKEYFK